jgi:NADH dehydrogenase (ubiquinone) Fe-S protein 3
MNRLFTFFLLKQRFNSFNSFSEELLDLVNNFYCILMNFAKYLQKSCSLFILQIVLNKELIEISVSKKYILHFLKFLRDHSLTKTTMLMDYTVIDYPGKTLRFEIILLLLSSFWNSRLKVRVFTNELLSLLTVTYLYKVAFWQEREIWDMFGVLFKNHTDLRRILTDYGFLGHPLRKDFPLTGFFELFFDDFKRNIVSAPVSLAQEYRFYTFRNPWVRL